MSEYHASSPMKVTLRITLSYYVYIILIVYFACTGICRATYHQSSNCHCCCHHNTAAAKTRETTEFQREILSISDDSVLGFARWQDHRRSNRPHMPLLAAADAFVTNVAHLYIP